MSQRKNKAKYRERKARRTPLESRIDLVEWVRVRSHMSRGRARKVIMAGSLKVDSHIIGYKQAKLIDGGGIKVPEFLVPAEWRGRIEVVKPEWLGKAMEAVNG